MKVGACVVVLTIKDQRLTQCLVFQRCTSENTCWIKRSGYFLSQRSLVTFRLSHLTPPLFLILSYLNSAIFDTANHPILEIPSSLLSDLIHFLLLLLFSLFCLFYYLFFFFSIYSFIVDNK